MRKLETQRYPAEISAGSQYSSTNQLGDQTISLDKM